MKSIIQNEETERYCYICKSTQYLEKHHTWHGTSNRKKADEDGLTIFLCSFCHRALHDRGQNDRAMMKVGERAWLRRYSNNMGDFIRRYGKNVI